MHLWPPHQYIKQGEALQRDAGTLERALREAHALQSRDLPAILTLNHLAVHLGVPYTYLRSVVGRRHDPYRAFPVRKRAGGTRIICVPEDHLMLAQRWIVRNILLKQTAHPKCMAYARGSSPLSCAKLHCGSSWLIKIDVQQFFESISEIDVYRVFRKIGYRSLVAFELSRICTRRPRNSKRTYPTWQISEVKEHKISAYSQRFMGGLPQGAPTSPILSNLCMYGFDKEVEQLAQHAGLFYTRYSDDLIFSTASTSYSREKAKAFVRNIYSKMTSVGLRPNTAKTVLAAPGARKIVLGLLVDTDRPRLPRELKDKLRSHIHYCEKFGPANHARAVKFDTTQAFKRHIYGLLTYAESVDSSFAKPLLERLGQVAWPVA